MSFKPRNKRDRDYVIEVSEEDWEHLKGVRRPIKSKIIKQVVRNTKPLIHHES